MLKIRFLGYDATWDSGTFSWSSPQDYIAALLDSIMVTSVLPHYSYACQFLDGGISGMVWRILSVHYPRECELVTMTDDSVTELPEKGVLH